METSTFVLLNCTLSFGVPLAIAIRELILLRRERDGGTRRPAVEPAPDPLPSPEGRDVAPRKPLPDCLIPKPLPAEALRSTARPRELEPV